MTSPSDAFNKAINGVEDFFTPAKVKAKRTYTRATPPVAAPGAPTYKFTAPKNQQQITQGQSNAQNPSKLPAGTMFGSNARTPQQKALNIKSK